MGKRKQNKPQVILGLDVSSSSTGYAILRGGRWNKSASSYGVIKTDSKVTLPQRLVSFRDQLSALLKRTKPDVVIIEDIFSLRNVGTLKLLARFSGVAMETCRRFVGEDPQLVMTTSVRSTLGCGMDKEAAFKYICDRYNLDWKISMNDVTDAVCLALYQHEVLKK